ETLLKKSGEPLPDLDNLNSAVPIKHWEIGLDGKPRPPWQLNFVAYLLDPQTGALYTFLNSTVGARIAVERLQERVRCMRLLRGADVVPLVELGNKPMQTQFGQKLRPEFKIIDWRDFGGGTPPKQMGGPVAPVTPSEELNDKIPW